MRTISSLRLVGALAPPTNVPTEFAMFVVGAGKMPALSRAVAFGLIMQDGITLPGNCPPEVIPAGGAWPGQLANRTLCATCGFAPVNVGTNSRSGLEAVRRPDRLPP